MRTTTCSGGIGILLLAASLSAENLIWNSGFELGCGNWEGNTIMEGVTQPRERCTSMKVTSGNVARGKYALHIPPQPGRIDTLISSHSFTVKENSDYNFSFDAMTDQPGMSVSVAVTSVQRKLVRDEAGNILPPEAQMQAAPELKNVARKFLRLSGHWTRYSISFRTDAVTKSCTVRFHFPKQKEGGSAWLDNIQVAPGKETPVYSAKAPLEAVVETSDHLYEKPEKIPGVLHLVSHDSDRKGTIELTLYDTFFGKKRKTLSIPYQLKQGEPQDIPFCFAGPIPYGGYCVYTSLQPRTTEPEFIRNYAEEPETLAFRRLRRSDESFQSAAFFVAVPTPRKHTAEGFRAGTTSSLSPDGTFTEKILHRKNFRLGDSDDYSRRIRLAGGNTHRAWDHTFAPWSRVEPEQGKFDWSIPDRQLQVAEAAGVDLICVLGGTFGKERGHIPFWARKRDRKDPEGVLALPGSYAAKVKPGYRFFQPQLEDWRNYVAAVATRYRGRIRFYEILNEPNLTMTAPMYLPYLESAAEEIRRIDPKAVILGLCSTSDFGGNLEDFVGQCLQLGAARFLDCITIHPYCTLDNSVPRTQMRMRRDVLANLRKVGVKAGLWNGENYYVLPSSRPWTEHSGRVRPEDIARHILVDLGEGCVGSTPTSMLTLSSCRIQATQADFGMNVRLYPDERYAAHAATMYFVTGARPKLTTELIGRGLAYTFLNRGRLYTAVWNSIQPGEFKLKVPPRAVVYDMMGNGIGPEGGELTLDARPWYLEWPEAETVETVQAWFASKPVSGVNPVQIGRVLLGREKEKSFLFVPVLNLTAKPLPELSLRAESGRFAEMVRGSLRDIPAMGHGIAVLPVRLKGGGKMPFPVRFVANGSPAYTVETEVPPVELISVGRRKQSFAVTRNTFGKPASAADLSAQLTIFPVRDGMLLLELAVQDDLRGKATQESWDTDSVELYLDRDVWSGDPKLYAGGTRKLVFLRGSGNHSSGGVECRMRENRGGYVAEFRIPVERGELLGLDLAVNDSDGEHRRSQLVWSGNSESYRDRSRFRLLRIADSAENR